MTMTVRGRHDDNDGRPFAVFSEIDDGDGFAETCVNFFDSF